MSADFTKLDLDTRSALASLRDTSIREVFCLRTVAAQLSMGQVLWLSARTIGRIFL